MMNINKIDSRSRVMIVRKYTIINQYTYKHEYYEAYSKDKEWFKQINSGMIWNKIWNNCPIKCRELIENKTNYLVVDGKTAKAFYRAITNRKLHTNIEQPFIFEVKKEERKF